MGKEDIISAAFAGKLFFYLFVRMFTHIRNVNGMIATRALAITTVAGAVTLGAVSGVFGTFYSTLQSGMNCTYGYGYDSSFGYGYGYGSANGYDCTAISSGGGGGSSSSTSGGGGGGGGGSPIVVSTPKTPTTPVTVTSPDLDKLLAVIKNIPGPKVALEKLAFKDINDNWAKGYIQKLAQRGIVNNAEKFNPEGRLTRAEFLKIVIKTTGWDLTGATLPGYEDVSSSHTLAKYIALGAKKGLVNKDAKKFRPDDTITRAEAMKILLVALGADVASITPASFDDVAKTSDLAKFIEKAKALGIVSGQGNKFRPNDSISRSEISKVVVNAFKL